MSERLNHWVYDNAHVLILLLLLFFMIGIVIYLMRSGRDPEQMTWAKEQIAAVLGALLFSLKGPAGKGGGTDAK